jgi:hypothetical protein
VATVVAQGRLGERGAARPAGEVERLLDADDVAMVRYESHPEVSIVAHRGPDPHAAWSERE